MSQVLANSVAGAKTNCASAMGSLSQIISHWGRSMGRRWLVGRVSGRRAQDICRRNAFFSVAWTDSSTLRADRQCCGLWEFLYHFPKGRASVCFAEMAAQRPRLARRRNPQTVIESQRFRGVTCLVGLRRSLAKPRSRSCRYRARREPHTTGWQAADAGVGVSCPSASPRAAVATNAAPDIELRPRPGPSGS